MADEQSAPTHYERLMQQRAEREQMKKDVTADLQIYQSEVLPAAERDGEERGKHQEREAGRGHQSSDASRPTI